MRRRRVDWTYRNDVLRVAFSPLDDTMHSMVGRDLLSESRDGRVLSSKSMSEGQDWESGGGSNKQETYILPRQRQGR